VGQAPGEGLSDGGPEAVTHAGAPGGKEAEKTKYNLKGLGVRKNGKGETKKKRERAKRG